jgi:hypothetical protein
MDTILHSQNEEQAFPLETGGEKSEIMQLFERQVSDAYWAYRDLLREIFESDNGAEA